MTAESALTRWVRFLWRHERFVRWSLVVVTLLAAASVTRLRLEMNLPSMLPDGHPAFSSFRSLVEDFSELDELLILARSDDALGLDAFRSEFVDALENCASVAQVFEPAGEDEVEELLRRYLPHLLPSDAFDELRERLRPEAIDEAVGTWPAILAAPGDLSGVRRLRRDPLGVLSWASRVVFKGVVGERRTPDDRSFLLVVRPVSSAFAAGFSQRLLREVRDAEEQARESVPVAGLRIGVTGSYAYAVEDEAILRADLQRYGGFALIAVLVVFAGAYRSLRIVPFAAVILVTITLGTFAASTLLFGRLDVVSLSFAAILYGLAIDSAIHFYTRLQEELGNFDPDEAVLTAWCSLVRPNLVASGTTAMAFAVATLSSLSPVRQLGALTAVGMLLNVAAFFLLYPVLGRSLATRLPRRAVDLPNLGRWARACGRAGRPIWFVVPAVLAILIAAGLPLDVDGSLDRLRPASTPARFVEDEIRSRTDGHPNTAVVLARADDGMAALETAYAIESLLDGWEAAGKVDGVAGPTRLVPPPALQMERLRRWSDFPFEAVRASYADSVRRHGFSIDSAPPAFGVLDTASGILSIDVPELDPFRPLLARYLRPDEEGFLVGVWTAPIVSPAELAGALEAAVPGAELASRAWVESELAVELRREVVRFSLVAFVTAGVLLWWSVRSVAVAAAVLLPTALTLAGLVAVLSFVDAGIDPVNVVLIPLVIGLAIDDGVYLTARWVDTGDLPAAFRLGGRAVIVTTLTTTVGFGLLGLSAYPALASLGLLAGTGMTLALLASVTSLPALLGSVESPGASR